MDNILSPKHEVSEFRFQTGGNSIVRVPQGDLFYTMFIGQTTVTHGGEKRVHFGATSETDIFRIGVAVGDVDGNGKSGPARRRGVPGIGSHPPEKGFGSRPDFAGAGLK